MMGFFLNIKSIESKKLITTQLKREIIVKKPPKPDVCALYSF